MREIGIRQPAQDCAQRFAVGVLGVAPRGTVCSVKSEIRLAEVLAGLSVATDLGMGQPPGHAARSCLLAVQIATDVGVRGAELSDVYYVALLRFLGCSADAPEVAGLAGNEIELAVGPFVMGDAGSPGSHSGGSWHLVRAATLAGVPPA